MLLNVASLDIGQLNIDAAYAACKLSVWEALYTLPAEKRWN